MRPSFKEILEYDRLNVKMSDLQGFLLESESHSITAAKGQLTFSLSFRQGQRSSFVLQSLVFAMLLHLL